MQRDEQNHRERSALVLLDAALAAHSAEFITALQARGLYHYSPQAVAFWADRRGGGVAHAHAA